MAVAYTETTIETMLRDTIGDPASNPAQRWTSAELIDLINRGGAQLILDIPNSLQTQWEITTADGTREYLLDTEFVSVERIEYEVDATNNDDDRQLTYLDKKEWSLARFPEDKSNTGDPQFYTFGRKLGDTIITTVQPMHLILEPAPDAIKKLRVYGYKMMQTLAASGSDVVEIQTPKLEAIMFWAGHIAFLSDDDGKRSDKFLGRYEMQVKKILNYQMDLDISRSPRMKPWNAGDESRPTLPWERRVV